MIFLVVDPGKECGYVEWDTEHGMLGQHEMSAYAAVSEIEHRIALEEANAKDDLPLRIIVERYTITPQTVKLTRQYDALETIGAIRYLARKHSIPFELQSRADRMRVSYEVLKKLGWYIPSLDGHANEATRHLIVAVTRHIPYHDLVKRVVGMI